MMVSSRLGLVWDQQDRLLALEHQWDQMTLLCVEWKGRQLRKPDHYRRSSIATGLKVPQVHWQAHSVTPDCLPTVTGPIFSALVVLWFLASALSM